MMDRSSLVLYSITAVPVYFPFTIHRNPIILVNAFNSPATHRHPLLATIDALLIIGMTKAISDRLSDAKRGEGGVWRAPFDLYLSVQSCNLPNGTNFPNVTRGTRSPNKSSSSRYSNRVFPKIGRMEFRFTRMRSWLHEFSTKKRRIHRRVILHFLSFFLFFFSFFYFSF